MSKRISALPLVCVLALAAPAMVQAQVGGGTWSEYSPSFNIQERGCGDVNNLVFTLTCSNTTDDNRAERRYVTYGGTTPRQFEGSFRITSLGGTRISLKQTFKDDPGAGPDFMMAVESGGRLYAVHGGNTIAPSGTATVGTTVRVNTIHRPGVDHRCYINGTLRFTVGSASGNYYDKFGFYRTSSGAGPGSVTWSNIHFWTQTSTGGGSPTPTPAPTATPGPGPTATPAPTATPGGGGFSGYYRITARHSGKAVVVQSASTANSANVFQWTYGGSATNDEWQVLSIGSGYYRVINRNSGKDLVVQSASTSEGANIFQYAYGGTATNDEWAIVDVGSGYFRITNRNSGKSAEVAGGGTADGTNVDQRTYSGATYQQFQLVSVP